MAESQRRLTTIVVADVAGFSRLIGIDEEGTLATQRSHRSELIEPLLLEYNGRIANTAGDSFLFEFSSAVEAVRYSIAVQERMAGRNCDIPTDRRIEYRIGINVGDVIADGDDLLGDGVNIAARLENICEPGGIMVTDDAYRQVRDRLNVDWEAGSGAGIFRRRHGRGHYYCAFPLSFSFRYRAKFDVCLQRSIAGFARCCSRFGGQICARR